MPNIMDFYKEEDKEHQQSLKVIGLLEELIREVEKLIAVDADEKALKWQVLAEAHKKIIYFKDKVHKIDIERNSCNHYC